jgi:hypothetical protein
MAAVEAPFSDLINKPRATLELLAGSYAHSIRLRRRDDVDLVVTTASRYEQEHTVIRVAVRLFGALMRHGEMESMLEVLPDAFPWVEFLPAGDREQFLTELVTTLRASDDIDNLAPVAQLITEWQHTAEVYADPALLAALRQDADDFGPVPVPDTAA